MTALLEVNNIKKYFKTPKGTLHAVDDVTFKIDKGKTLGVVGESGCGKSTLGRTVIHLLDRTDGQIVFDGKDISEVSKDKLKELRKDMQMIFQDPFSSLNPRMSISQIIAEPLIIYKVFKSTKELNKRVSELMDIVGLSKKLANSYPHELDGGRRQRIGVARAIALNPKFIVCDEPVSALDVSIQAQVLNLMKDIQDDLGIAYMFITHDLSVVKHVSNEILVMYLGKVVEFSTKDDLFENRLHPYTKALLAAIPIPEVRHNIKRNLLKGEITSPIDPKPGCRFASRCDYVTDICYTKNPEMIEAIPNHFVSCHHVMEINGLDS